MIWDPLRKKEVADTPEERVRQWFIGVLADSAGVPLHLMGSEVSLEYGDKKWRADIVIYGRDGGALGIVECKRPSVEITAEVAQQALRYSAVLSVQFIFLTNGNFTYIYKRDSDGFKQFDHLPTYEEICQP